MKKVTRQQIEDFRNAIRSEMELCVKNSQVSDEGVDYLIVKILGIVNPKIDSCFSEIDLALADLGLGLSHIYIVKNILKGTPYHTIRRSLALHWGEMDIHRAKIYKTLNVTSHDGIKDWCRACEEGYLGIE